MRTILCPACHAELEGEFSEGEECRCPKCRAEFIAPFPVSSADEVERVVDMFARMFGRFSWRESQRAWMDIEERHAAEGGTIWSTALAYLVSLPAHELESVKPAINACATCVESLADYLDGRDSVSAAILQMSLRARVPQKVFICLALGLHNAMVATKDNSLARRLCLRSYDQIATHYDRTGTIPSAGLPDEREVQRAALQELGIRPKSGCLIPILFFSAAGAAIAKTLLAMT